MNPVIFDGDNTFAGHAFMKRALQLASFGAPRVSPNPMVGAVVVAKGRIIGEGYHRLFGEAHAEVNAIASVSEEDRPLLRESTIYVTLEPCSHFGKTPPCADLIISSGIPHAVIAVEDPFLKDFDSGIDRMRKAGIDVQVGMMKEEALWLNRRFFTAHTLKRPFILLKWAQSADSFIADAYSSPIAVSNAFTRMLMHRERAMYDAVMVGVDTVINDRPQLTCRSWPCRNPEERPLKVTFRSDRLLSSFNPDYYSRYVMKDPKESLPEFMHRLYEEHKITSLMVEGGTKTLSGFIENGIMDEIRVETGTLFLGQGIPAPDISGLHLRRYKNESYAGNHISFFNSGLFTPPLC